MTLSMFLSTVLNMRHRFYFGLSFLFLTVSFQAQSYQAKENTPLSWQFIYSRLGFGPRPLEIKKLPPPTNQNYKNWLKQQMNPVLIQDSVVDSKVAALSSLHMTTEQRNKTYKFQPDLVEELGIKVEEGQNKKDLREIIKDKIGDSRFPSKMEDDIIDQRLIRAVESRRQLQEVLTYFWMNHFNIYIDKDRIRWSLADFEANAIRKNIFGNFKDMLLATAEHPAMLIYLDNRLSKKNKINENYAREIMELHTLGVDGGYSQNDVMELSRILTGWEIQDLKNNPEFKFNLKNHDTGLKKFLGVEFPEGSDQSEGLKAIEMLALHDKTAERIALKLCQFFVEDEPNPKLVSAVKRTFLTSHGDLKQTYLALFQNPLFLKSRLENKKIKSPLHFVASSIRALSGEVEPHSDLRKYLSKMSEQPYFCGPPTGYSMQNTAWVNAGSLVERLNFSLALTSNKINGVFVTLPNFPSAKDLGVNIQNVAANLGIQKLSKSTIQAISKELSGELLIMADGETRAIPMRKIVGLLLGSPEFQSR